MAPKKVRLSADDLECSEGGIHDFHSYFTGGDYCKVIFCCPCVCLFEIFCDCSLCGARDPERDGFGICGRASGKKPCVKCGMTYEKAESELAVMTDDEKQRVWNATYGEGNVYTTRAQEREQHRLEVVASHHDQTELRDAYSELHDGQQRRPSATPSATSKSGYPRQPPPDAGESPAPPPYHS